MSRLDYSKWDKFDYNSSDDEVDQTSNQPIVTRLNDGATVHIGPSGSSIANNTPQNSHTRPPPPSVQDDTLVDDDDEYESSVPPLPCSAGIPISKARGTVYRSSHTPDEGGFPITYKWKQNRQEVCLWVSIASSLKASALKIEYNQDSNVLRISTNGIDILSGELKYKIDYSKEDGLDWEITTPPNNANTSPSSSSSSSNQEKVIQITFQKFVYTAGSVVWWSSVFATDDPIDVTQIPERLQTQKLVKNDKKPVDKDSEEEVQTKISSTESFAEAWKTAHALFTEKVKEKEPIVVEHDINDKVCDSDEDSDNHVINVDPNIDESGEKLTYDINTTTSNLPTELVRDL
mmetsp:Transcript_13404/g.21979  ORF Transcript_13404/g.21979 Transcript_13404/m.21979 type:complete len:347 (+) Transcript_13404:149-1189(+)